MFASLFGLAGLARGFVGGIAPKAVALQSVSNRFLAPNGTERNIVFTLENDSFSTVSGRIYDIQGRKVADMIVSPDMTKVTWDGSGADHGGVYIYVITAGSKTISGTVVVIR